MQTDQTGNKKAIREPSLLDALIPLIFMIVLLDRLDRVVRARCGRRPAAGGVVDERGGGSRGGAQERPFLGDAGRGDRQRHLHRHERHHDLADGGGADRGLEHVRNDRHHGLLWRSNTSIHPGFTLLRRCSPGSSGLSRAAPGRPPLRSGSLLSAWPMRSALRRPSPPGQ